MKAAIFDLDGTLLDSMDMWRNMTYDFLKEQCVEVHEDIDKLINQMTYAQAAEIISEKFLPDMSPAEIMACWDRHVIDMYKTKIQLKPYVKEYLQKLKKDGVKMCIATLSERTNIENALTRLGVMDMFEFILTVTEAGKSKEHPHIFIECGKRCGCDISDCVVFEDSFTPINTAKSAGFTVYAIYDKAAGKHKDDIMSLCDRYVNSFEELL